MQIAISARQNSGCLSRHVGAAVVNHDGYVLGIGWNDPPKGQIPCSLRTVRELMVNLDEKAFSQYERSQEFLKHLRSRYPDSEDCPYCFKKELNLLEGREVNEYTRALHAEENALMQAAKQGYGEFERTTLYTTDSPCTLCSKKAYDFGVKRIVYIEEYPGLAVQHSLKTGSKVIEIHRFEGIVGAAYFTLFASLVAEKDLITLYM